MREAVLVLGMLLAAVPLQAAEQWLPAANGRPAVVDPVAWGTWQQADEPEPELTATEEPGPTPTLLPTVVPTATPSGRRTRR